MISVFYEGYNNQAERDIIDSASEFAAAKLFPRFKVDITFRFIKNLKEKEKIEGDVVFLDDSYRPRDFIVRVHKGLAKDDLITLVIHEFVHIKQYMRKELYFKFDKKKWTYKVHFKGRNVDNVKYLDQPHEKEAYRLQEKLYKEYINTIS